MAVNVIVSEPFQSAGVVIVATRFTIDYRQLRITAVCPGHLRIGVIHIRYIVIQVDRGKGPTFRNCLVGYVGHHRRIIHRGHRECGRITVECNRSRVCGRKRYCL